MQSKGITLLGMPGSGKTTIGKLLAIDLGLKFLDLDELIKKQTSIFHNEYLEKYGNDGLVKLEEKITITLDLTDKLFSPGGSIVYSHKAMRKIKIQTTVVLFEVPLEILTKRITKLDTRGIVGLKKYGFKQLYKLRMPLYKKYADITLSISNEKPDVVKKLLLQKLGNSTL